MKETGRLMVLRNYLCALQVGNSVSLIFLLNCEEQQAEYLKEAGVFDKGFEIKQGTWSFERALENIGWLREEVEKGIVGLEENGKKEIEEEKEKLVEMEECGGREILHLEESKVFLSHKIEAMMSVLEVFMILEKGAMALLITFKEGFKSLNEEIELIEEKDKWLNEHIIFFIVI